MQPTAPHALLAQATEWEDLTRWERAEIGRALRRLGWTYSEIRKVIPVPKGTLSGWCAGVELTEDQVAAIARRTRSALGVPRDTQWRRRDQIAAIRQDAAAQVPQLLSEPLWLAGTTMYWAEGAKTSNRLSLANSDPRILRLFVNWVDAFLRSEPEYVLKLNLHYGNDEPAARRFWETELGMIEPRFYKTFIKPEGTGHRKNHLPAGVCAVIVRRSSDLFHYYSGWIDGLAPLLTSPTGR